MRNNLTRLTCSSLTTTISGTKKLKRIATVSLDDPRGLESRVRGIGGLASGPFKIGFTVKRRKEPFSRCLSITVRRRIPIVSVAKKGPTPVFSRLGNMGIGGLMLITTGQRTMGTRRLKTSTIVIINRRNNKRLNESSVKAFILMPRITSTMSVPIVTSKKVKSNENLVTTLDLNTRNVRVKAEFITAGRYMRTSRLCGGHLIRNARGSAMIVGEAVKTPTEIVTGS